MAVSQFGGREIKALGDGLMVAFPSALTAVRCAISMQEAVTADGQGEMLRVGLDAGEPIRLDDDLFGTPVVVARRLCDLAQGGEILASDLVSRLVGRRLTTRFRPLGPLAVKGLSQPLDTVAIDWRGPDPTPESSTAKLAAGAIVQPPAPARRSDRRRAIAIGALLAVGIATVGAVALLSGTSASSPPARTDGSIQVFRPSTAGYSAQHPCYARGGEQLLFTLFTNGYNNPSQKGSAILYALQPQGGSPRPIVFHLGNAAVGLSGSCYSPVSHRIAYSSDRAGTDNVWTASPDRLNERERQVTCYTAPSLHAGEASWSADGRSIAYVLVNDTAHDRSTIWKVPARNDCSHPTAPTRIVPGLKRCGGPPAGDNHEPNWAPTGSSIVFQSQPSPPDGPINLWTVRPDGCGVKRITNDVNQDTDPSWAPNGREIVYSTNYGSPTGTPNLFLVPARADGPKTRLTSQCYYDGSPAWSPDGKWVSFETWPIPNPSGADIPTALWQTKATARPHAPAC